MTLSLKNLTTILILSCLALIHNLAFGQGPSFEERGINEVGWRVTYLGCEFSVEDDVATYSYSVTVSPDEKDLSHWVLALDGEIIPVSSTGGPTTEFGLDPTTGVFGFKWDDGQLAGSTEVYTISFNGECAETDTDYSVKGGTYYAVGGTTGPGGDGGTGPVTTFSVSGLVYLDVDGNGLHDIDEPIFANTSVHLFDENNELIATITTDANGEYLFGGLTAGEYSISVPALTDDETDFNEVLDAYFTALSDMQFVSVSSEDITDINFGFSLNVNDVLDDINTDDPDGDGYSFDGTGKTIGYWKHQHSVAIRGKGRAHVDEATLLSYLDGIENSWLVDPFQFGVDPIGESFDILSARTSDATELLNKQLMGCELNYMDGRGLSDQMELMGVILNWAEYMSYQSVMFTREELLEAKDLIDYINNSGN